MHLARLLYDVESITRVSEERGVVYIVSLLIWGSSLLGPTSFSSVTKKHNHAHRCIANQVSAKASEAGETGPLKHHTSTMWSLGVLLQVAIRIDARRACA